MSEPNVTILLIEDEPQIRRFVRTALEAEGWKVLEADTGQRGLIDAGTRRPDLLILDLGLPDMSIADAAAAGAKTMVLGLAPFGGTLPPAWIQSCIDALEAGMDVAIISGDRDLLQLATDHVMVRIPKTKKTGTEIENYNTADVIEKYGVTPKEFIDVKALQGDTSDNIPGVPGIGEKTAGALIAKYHCIEAVHEDAENVKPPKASKNIVEYWEQALMSKELATIILDAPVDYEFSDAKLSGGVESLYTEEAFLLCKRYEFKNMLSRFNVEAPKNNAEEHFVVVRDLKTAESVFEKAKGREVAFAVVPGESLGNSESDGQLSLFSEPVSNDYLAVSICFIAKV